MPSIRADPAEQKIKVTYNRVLIAIPAKQPVSIRYTLSTQLSIPIKTRSALQSLQNAADSGADACALARRTCRRSDRTCHPGGASRGSPCAVSSWPFVRPLPGPPLQSAPSDELATKRKDDLQCTSHR